MKHLFTLCCTLALCTAHAQTLLITESEHRAGERSLSLSGFFRDADTVLVQVYHDSDVLYEEVAVRTWALTMSEHDYYTIKFTDGQHRVKRMSIHELSDNQIEFVPPMEIDFGVAGNLVLIKQRDGKMDFLQYDVGMSRKVKDRRKE